MVSPTTPWFVWFPAYCKDDWIILQLFSRSTVVPSCLPLFFCTWSNQSWLFPRSLNMSTTSSRGGFPVASCVIKSSITNWTSPKKERRHDKLVGHRIVPVCLICRSPVVWAVALFPSAGADMIFVNNKKTMPPAVLEPKNPETKWRSEYLLICNESVWVSVSTNITSGAGLPRFRLRLPNLIPLSGFFLRAVRHCHLMSTN